MGVLTKLKDLADRAGRWLAPSRSSATNAIVANQFDRMAWRDVLDQSAALRTLADDLGESHDYVAELLQDVWTAAYKSAPHLRPGDEMDPSRLVNHQVIKGLMDVSEFSELRRHTVGDPYVAAMAVLAHANTLRHILAQAEAAQQAAAAAAEARQQQADAAHELQATLKEAEQQVGPDDELNEQAAAAVEAAIDTAQAATGKADQAAHAAAAQVAAVAPGIRMALRAAANTAAEQAREEAALMASWGVSPGQLQRMSFEERLHLANRLRTGRLSRFADLIGRFRVMAGGERARKIAHSPGELVGITLGDDLSRVIPSELASLAIPTQRALFAARLAERRLMCYDTRGNDQAGKGAIIACVDCSYSMSNPLADGVTGEAWAKALALALLDQAHCAKRDFVGILFSSASELEVFHFPASRPRSIDEVLDFGEHFFGGGTDFAAPLDAAVEVLQAEYNDAGTQRGDIVFVTDGQCEVTEDWMLRWLDAKRALGFRTWGVAVAQAPGQVLEALSDNVRTVMDVTDVRSTGDMFRVI
ncbi:VWA domain-containing protein [Nonomuraea maheshkhaliensis]|uniref:VWA domain-containing protein n=1 Tax=Nonomuraea maheshkhaliensis TaxID=419590 RepID=A0ABP4QMX6_9ACTN